MARDIPDIEILRPEEAGQKEARVRARFWPTVKKAVRSIPFIEEVVAAYYAMLDPATPTSARLTLVAALAYFVAPFDLVPDLILGIGFLDDASVLAAAIAAVRGSIKPEHREAARRALADGAEAP
ncbi:MAG: YkvA family protein [Propylenella sp.]